MSDAGPLILIIDDEPSIRSVVRSAIDQVARVREASTGRAGTDIVAADRPDLVILDLGLPDTEGLKVCAEIRRWSQVPIMVLSARHSDEEKVRLLDAGADDYVTKPFNPAELRARVQALLRRATTADAGPRLAIGDLTLDIPARVLMRDGEMLHLTPLEWDLLRVFMLNAGRTLTHQQLFRAVWSGRVAGDAQQYLRVHVANLRRKIETDALRPRYIQTEVGVGYRFVTALEFG